MAGKTVIADRIFLNNRMLAENIKDRWDLLAAEKDLNRMCDYWRDLHATLVRMAHDDLDI